MFFLLNHGQSINFFDLEKGRLYWVVNSVREILQVKDRVAKERAMGHMGIHGIFSAPQNLLHGGLKQLASSEFPLDATDAGLTVSLFVKTVCKVWRHSVSMRVADLPLTWQFMPAKYCRVARAHVMQLPRRPRSKRLGTHARKSVDKDTQTHRNI